MDFLKKLNLKTSTVLKIAGLALVAIIVVSVGFRLVGSSFDSTVSKRLVNNVVSQSAPAYDAVKGFGEMVNYDEGGSAGLSVRNVAGTPNIMPIVPGSGTTGDNAEALEVTDYNATIETRHLDQTCGVITNLKAREDVVFENANRYDQGCNYVFKVKSDKVNEILGIVKGLNPKELVENTYTIQQLVEDFTSETDILTKKLAAVDDTLQKAMGAYDEVTALATKVQDVESLAKIIDSKINIIERLTQERINVNAQLEQITRAKEKQLDRLDYAYFNVNIFENKFIDFKNLADSWKNAIKEFVQDVNRVAQDVSVTLLIFLLVIFRYLVYSFLLLIVAKYAWQLAKHVWKK